MNAQTLPRIWRGLTNAIPWAAAVLCFAFVSPKTWADASGPLVTALALLCGAILLRIMRPFPITDPDGFAERDEIDVLERTIQHVMLALSFAAGVAVVSIVLLVFRSGLTDIDTGIAKVDALRGEMYSAVLGWTTIFVATRIVYVVRMDFSLIRRQARAVRHSYDKRRASELDDARRANNEDTYVFNDDGEYPGREPTSQH